MQLTFVIGVNLLLAWLAFLAETRFILAPAPKELVFLLFFVNCILYGFARKNKHASQLCSISIFLLLAIQYVKYFTRWYVYEIPDILIYSFIDGEVIVNAYWTLALLPAIPAAFTMLRITNSAIEEGNFNIKDLPFWGVVGEEDLVICKSMTGKRIVVPGNDRYLNTLIGGSIGTGKSSRLLAPIIYQELREIQNSLAKGIPRGLTCLEPKGDLTDKIAEMCEDLGIPYVYINPLRDDTARFNPLEGDPMLVAEATRTVLRSIGGKQEAFFALAQEVAARNTILLLKYTRGNNLSLPDVSSALRVTDTLKSEVGKLEHIIKTMELENTRLLENIRRIKGDTETLAITQRQYEDNRLQISGRKGVVDYFNTEVFGKLQDKMFQFVLGLRLQFDDLAGNELLYKVIAPRLGEDGRLNYSSDVNLDDHLANGGVLLVNSASNSLGRVGDAFGGYVLQHLQGAVFRRPGDETTRPRHTTVIDEVPSFIGPAFERMLSNGRSYRNENIIALQTTAQLILDEKSTFRETIMNLCRNKIFYGGMDAEEAKYISAEMGESLQSENATTYNKSAAFKMPWLRQAVRETEKDKARFTYTNLMELERYHVVYKVVQNNVPQQPGIGITDLCEWDKARNKSGRTIEKKDVALQKRLGKSANIDRPLFLSRQTTETTETEAINENIEENQEPQAAPVVVEISEVEVSDILELSGRKSKKAAYVRLTDTEQKREEKDKDF